MDMPSDKGCLDDNHLVCVARCGVMVGETGQYSNAALSMGPGIFDEGSYSMLVTISHKGSQSHRILEVAVVDCVSVVKIGRLLSVSPRRAPWWYTGPVQQLWPSSR